MIFFVDDLVTNTSYVKKNTFQGSSGAPRGPQNLKIISARGCNGSILIKGNKSKLLLYLVSQKYTFFGQQISQGHPQSKLGKSQEVSGIIGCLRIF